MTYQKKLMVCLGVAVLITAMIHGCVSVTAQMSSGERLYRANCASCHRLIGPEEHDAAMWSHYVDEYGTGLDEVQKREVLVYLTQGK
ncbi:MAG: cytochrome c [Phycisphaerales bacterium]|nr:MAG: cytochrome c [Phycisphaerales bacterium]